MRRGKINLVMLLMIGLLGWSCQSDYSKMVKDELASGVRNDSIFFDIRFGQTQKQFFEIVWDFNKKKVLNMSTNGKDIRYELGAKGEEEPAVIMDFYPEFSDSLKIEAMDVSFSYHGWAPWNDDYQSKNLLPDVLETFNGWYGGNEFIQVETENEPEGIWVKVDGNRRIAVRIKDDQLVQAKISDLTSIEN